MISLTPSLCQSAPLDLYMGLNQDLAKAEAALKYGELSVPLKRAQLSERLYL